MLESIESKGKQGFEEDRVCTECNWMGPPGKLVAREDRYEDSVPSCPQCGSFAIQIIRDLRNPAYAPK